MFLANRLRAAAGAGIPPDYIALWEMGGNANDETGNYDITLYNGAQQESDHVYFDGNNDYGQCSRLAINDNELTIVTRVRFESLDDDGTWLITSASETDGNEREWQLNCGYGGDNRPVFIPYGFPSSDRVYFSSSVSTGVWYVIAVRLDSNGVLEMYNGQSLQESVTTTGTLNTGSAHTRFARRGWLGDDSPSEHGEMSLGKTVAYDRGVSDNELSKIIDFISNG